MIATIFSILIAAWILYSSFFTPGTVSPPSWHIFAASAFFFLFAYVLAQVFAWGPLQRIQQNLTPRILDLYKKDTKIRLGGAFLAILAIFSLYLAVDDGIARKFGEYGFTALFIVLIGISVDVIHYVFSRMTSYINPFTVATECKDHAVAAAVKGDDAELTHWIEAVAEVGINSAGRSLLSLCNQTITDLQLITKEYLEAAKSFFHSVKNKAEGEKGDPVNFTLFFIFQRFEIIFIKAMDTKLEPVVSTLITSIGKIIIDCAKYDMSITTYPIHFLGTLALKAQKGGMEEIGSKALVTYVEVTKVITSTLDLTYLELQEPFYTLIGKMEEISKEMFQKNREMNLSILTAPFKQLRACFESDKLINHQDSRLIIIDINRVINEYEQLELVLKTIPPLQTAPPEGPKT